MNMAANELASGSLGRDLAAIWTLKPSPTPPVLEPLALEMTEGEKLAPLLPHGLANECRESHVKTFPGEIPRGGPGATCVWVGEGGLDKRLLPSPYNANRPGRRVRAPRWAGRALVVWTPSHAGSSEGRPVFF